MKVSRNPKTIKQFQRGSWSFHRSVVCIQTALMSLLLVMLAIPSLGFSQMKAPACPPPPIPPTVEEVQSLVKAAKDHGFLWRYEKDGKTGYLYGSIHMARREWMVPGPKTLAALQSSEVIALELDVLDPLIQAQLADPSQFGIRNVTLPPPLKRRMEVVAKRVCAPVDAFDRMHPLMQLLTVTMLEARFFNLEAGYGSEMFLAGFARGAKRPLESLETPELQLRALLDVTTQDVLETVEEGLMLFETGKQHVLTERLVSVWATRNLGELQRYMEWCECIRTETDRKYMKGLLDDRNSRMAAGIDRLSRTGRKPFVAVGALHMVGPNSLLTLLGKMGYKIERVMFNNL
ncbi:MAG TPA: TraB/GumN family protein [Nitrospira sp.]|nr:TraB/GumN family protein [Nitrospira sp.]